MTAARGIPKFEAGPRKSGEVDRLSATVRLRVHHSPECRTIHEASMLQASGCAELSGLTGREQVVRVRIGPDFGIESFDCGGHCD